jgi:hypothetical protein
MVVSQLSVPAAENLKGRAHGDCHVRIESEESDGCPVVPDPFESEVNLVSEGRDAEGWYLLGKTTIA